MSHLFWTLVTTTLLCMPTTSIASDKDHAEVARTHRYEHSSSWKKPSSESHQWSYKRACDACLSEVERRHGVDWKVTDVEFEDKGRSTKTSQDWRGRRTWKCTHTVVAKYNIVRRGHESTRTTGEVDEIKITYLMQNPFYNPDLPAGPERSSRGNQAEAAQTHRYEHSASWKKPSSESHQWSFKGACDECLAEIETRHGVDWKVTDVEFEDKGRTTQTSQDWQGRRKWRCTHTVVAKYNIVRRGRESQEANTEVIIEQATVRYRMIPE